MKANLLPLPWQLRSSDKNCALSHDFACMWNVFRHSSLACCPNFCSSCTSSTLMMTPNIPAVQVEPWKHVKWGREILKSACVSGEGVRLKHWVLNSVSWFWIPVHHKVPLWLSAVSYWCFATFHLTLSIKVIPKEHLHPKTCSPWVSPVVSWQRWRTQTTDSDYRWPDSPSIRSLSD